MSKKKKPGFVTSALARFLLFDLLFDKQSRVVLIYAASTIFSGAIIYHWVEGWEWLDSFYFVVITTTTIGYGDLAPQTDLGKFITIFFALNGVAILVMLFDQIRRVRRKKMASRISERRQDQDQQA
jgi:hypothetical protein